MPPAVILTSVVLTLVVGEAALQAWAFRTDPTPRRS
jgi:hypothetical protein